MNWVLKFYCDVQAQEAERFAISARTARSTGQSLTAASLELKGIELQLAGSNRARAQNLRKTMKETGKTLHRIAWEFLPTCAVGGEGWFLIGENAWISAPDRLLWIFSAIFSEMLE